MALSTLFARVFKVTPGRAFWSLITCVAGTVLIFAHTLDYINQVLAAEAILLFAWIGVIVADSTVVRSRLKLPVGAIEHRRAYLRRYNPIELTSFAAGVVVGAALHYLPGSVGLSGATWEVLSGLASFVALLVAFAVHPVLVVRAARRCTRFRAFLGVRAPSHRFAGIHRPRRPDDAPGGADGPHPCRVPAA